MFRFTVKDQQTGKRVFKKFKQEKNRNPKWFILTFNELFKILDNDEEDFIKKILKINPQEFGKKGEFFGIKPIPKNLVIIKNQKCKINGKIRIIQPQFLPPDVLSTYQHLNRSMKKEIGCSVNVLSGYRSPAYQTAVFFCNLYLNNWNIRKTLKSVALPGWSEHGNPRRQAIDFGPVRGITKIKNFYKTKEYKWLLKNAKRFGFFLSYPRNNKLGTIFEPWHWHFKKENNPPANKNY